MCGIIGGRRDSGGMRQILLRGLAALEYRGYDSAGLAFAAKTKPRRIAVAGRVDKLRAAAQKRDGACGIAHTRWATHGAPVAHNAHPIIVGQVALVHNGIIENHSELRRELLALGRVFHTDTDSETAAHLLDLAMTAGADLLEAMRQTTARLEGAFALAAVAAEHHGIAFARQGSPLLLGGDDRGNLYVASDIPALRGVASRIFYLQDGDLGQLTAAGAAVVRGKKSMAPRWRKMPPGAAAVSLGTHKHFMLKEIFEQPEVMRTAWRRHFPRGQLSPTHFGGMARLRQPQHIALLACGTSYHAALTAEYWLRGFGVSCRAAMSSEYRYSAEPQAADSLAVAISQSGETADTLAAMRTAQNAGATTLALVNETQSAMAREADLVIPAFAGSEIGVASTKAFTAQLAQLLAFSLTVAKARGALTAAQEKNILARLRRLPHLLEQALLSEKIIRRWAKLFATATSALFIGRREHYPLALEGALKLKEISYIHAEGCAAGELKHGSLALIDEHLPVVGLVPANDLQPKMSSNLSEVAARGGKLFILAGDDETAYVPPAGAEVLRLQDGGDFLSPLVFAVPLQLLAYHTARQMGTDIDKPRNLAKSVTVE